jgi:hypothetical protein
MPEPGEGVLTAQSDFIKREHTY